MRTKTVETAKTVETVRTTKTALDLVIRVGDLVRIIDPRAVYRVGYPKTPRDYDDTTAAMFEQEVVQLMARAANRRPKTTAMASVAATPSLLSPLPSASASAPFEKMHERRFPGRSRSVRTVLQELSYERCRADKFGGPERSLHLSPPYLHDHGSVACVASLRTVQTGQHYGPSGGYCHGSGEYDYESGGLADRVTRRLATLYDFRHRFRPHNRDVLYSSSEFPVNHLWKLAPCPKHPDPGERDVHPFMPGQCYYCEHVFRTVDPGLEDGVQSRYVFLSGLSDRSPEQQDEMTTLRTALLARAALPLYPVVDEIDRAYSEVDSE